MKLSEHWFVVSDFHFGHKMLVENDHRPQDYENLIVSGWNSVVNKHDNVLFLGDLTFINKEKTRNYCEQLSGRKWMVRGNHDSASDRWYRDCGFSIIEPIYKEFGKKDEEPYIVLFTHEPVVDLPEGWFNIHGHLHGNDHRGEKPTDRHFDVSVDAINYVPQRIYKVIENIRIK